MESGRVREMFRAMIWHGSRGGGGGGGDSEGRSDRRCEAQMSALTQAD